MVRYRRSIVPGGTFFFTVVTFDRMPFLTEPIARQCLHAAWKQTTYAYPFKTDAVCLLPDHIHCIWTLPNGDSEFSIRWKMIKSLFTRSWLQNDGREGHRNIVRKKHREAAVWQRRYWEHVIQDDNDLSKHFDYIHYNPVKHGFVNHPARWPWSTFHKYVRTGWYDPDWGDTLSEPVDGSYRE